MSAPVTIDRLDHMVLTVADIEATCAFYGRVLGMEKVVFAGGRTALAFGRQKINLHPAGDEYVPHAGCRSTSTTHRSQTTPTAA